MYRQILVNSWDTDYQRIMWQITPRPITDYCLLTVTYCTVAAPYLTLLWGFVLEQLVEMMKMPNFRSQLYVIRHMLTIALLAQTIRFLLVKHTIN